MKNIQLIISALLLLFISTFVYADFTNLYGTYESRTHRELFGINKNSTPEQKEYSERMRISITINENNIIMLLGGNSEEPLKLNYYIIKNNFLLAYWGEGSRKMYHPVYFKNNTIYTMGQKFEKNKSNK